jgi:IclR family pca regulon transcriptional regulator
MSMSYVSHETRRTPSDHYVQSLARGLAVIRTFSAEAPRQTLTQVATRAGLDRAGARRILLTLQTLGYVRQEGRNFLPMPNILHLGYSYLSTIPWWSMAERKMIKLVDAVNESTALGVLAGSHIVSVVCVHATKNLPAVNLVVGRRSPAYCTAIGRVLLGALPEQDLIQLFRRKRPTKRTNYTVASVPELLQIIERDLKQGWSFVSREYNDSVCSIAVPVYSQTNQLMAAMSVSEAYVRTNPKKMVETVLPYLKRTAERLWD